MRPLRRRADGAGYRTSPDADPRHIYHNVLVGLDVSRQRNNGQPSANIGWIDSLQPRAGLRALHVGCGVGYYTAIIAEVVGPAGRVVGYESVACARRAADRDDVQSHKKWAASTASSLSWSS